MREEIQNTLSEQILNLRQILIEREALLISNNLDKNVIDALTNEVKILKKKLSREVDKLINDGVSHQNPITEAQNITREIFDLEIKKTQLESKEKEYKKLLDEYLFSRSMLPSKNMELQRLNRSKLIKEQLFTLLNTKYEETKITQISKSENIRVIDPAIGGFLVSPVMSQIYLLGIAIGTILAILFIFSYEYFDRTVKSPEQIQGIGLQLIGIIPLMSKGKNYVENLLRNNHQVDDKNNNQNDYQQRLITHNDPMNPVSESYRSIRTNISHADTNKDIQMVMVTSPSPSEGKTTNVLNIAISYAQLNKKTLVIDSDLRKPKIHKAFNLNREPGLSDILSDSVGYDDCISKTNIDNLYIIPSGKLFNNPSELLGSSNMKSFIKSIKKEFDIVIFDTPPVVAVTDARVYMSYIDATILIVKAGQTDLRLLKRASNMLRSVKSPMIGCILNGFSNKHSYYGDYYYYNQYYYTDEG